MGHHRSIEDAGAGYGRLADRLNRFPQGAPPTELLFKILRVLFSEREAGLVSLLPIKPFTDRRAADIWKMPLAEARKILGELADRGILIDSERKDGVVYALPPPMAGFFEFSLMRIRNDIDQKALAELYYQYLNVEEDFVKALFFEGETRIGRAFVNEIVLTNDNALHVLDYERASEVVKTASHIGVGICYCRHKMAHAGKRCAAPLDICMTFNATADSLIRHGIVRKVDAPECLDLLGFAREHHLVQLGENVQRRVSFICNCCSCCCEALVAARKFGFLNPVHTTNFIPRVVDGNCRGCGVCASLCPVEALSLIAAGEPGPGRPPSKKVRLDEERCLGCGVCVSGCRHGAIGLVSRPERVLTPVNSAARVVMMAIERGKLQHLIFDRQAGESHRAMAAVLGVILKLPPVKQAMASRQFKSRYLEALIKRSLHARRR
ncbi:MAG: 4Fe-4S binding protein [Acidobacteriota bacterium]